MPLLLCGNYGAGNLGDEAILDGLIVEIKKTQPKADLEVLSYDPTQTYKLHQIKSHYLLPFGFRSLFRGVFKGELKRTLKAIKQADIFILGGGALLTDEKIRAIFLWGWQVLVAKLYKKPVWIYGQSLGPLKTWLGRYLTKKILRPATKIIVRDQLSVDLIKNLGLQKPVELRPDPAFSLDFKPRPDNQSGIVISLRPWLKHQKNTLKIMSQFIDHLVETEQKNVTLLPFQKYPDDDEQILQNLYSQIKNKQSVILKKYNPDYKEAIKIIGQAELLIGMRLHSLIFAEITKTPYLALIYSQKITGFLETVNKTDHGIDLENLDFKTLKNKFQSVNKFQKNGSHGFGNPYDQIF